MQNASFRSSCLHDWQLFCLVGHRQLWQLTIKQLLKVELWPQKFCALRFFLPNMIKCCLFSRWRDSSVYFRFVSLQYQMESEVCSDQNMPSFFVCQNKQSLIRYQIQRQILQACSEAPGFLLKKYLYVYQLVLCIVSFALSELPSQFGTSILNF